VAQARREKGVREHRDIRQIDVAKAIGVSGATISDCESDKKVPGEPILAKLAKYLDTTPAYLRYGIGEAGPISIEQLAAETGATYVPPDQKRPAEEVLREMQEAQPKPPAKHVAGGRKRAG
jgi:transcriptional regulator with XRE-family HTH domain